MCRCSRARSSPSARSPASLISHRVTSQDVECRTWSTFNCSYCSGESLWPRLVPITPRPAEARPFGSAMQGSALSHICDVGPSPGVRQDGREWDDFRTLIVSNNAIGTSPASASVRLGNTFVLAGVSTHLTTPARETPTSGRVNVQVYPL